MKKFFSVAVCAAIIGWVGNAFADSYSVAYNNSGTVFNTTGLTGYQTDGFDMRGMDLTIYFTDGTSTTATWGNLPGSYSGITVMKGNDSFTMRVGDNADTYTAIWETTSAISGSTNSLSIDKIFIDAGAGDTVFDVVYGSTGTPGSADGRPFTVSDFGFDYDILATYSGQVALNGTVYGDLYRYLTIDFINGAFGPADSYTSWWDGKTYWYNKDFVNFKADADNLAIAGDLNPVPEPATMLLFGTGLAGLAAAGRRKDKK